jgi:glycosyltransferase involved in cell wall biosynthesis
MDFSVVIPLYNEEQNLPLLQERLHTVCEGTSRSYEIIYIDDGSTDSSLEILKKIKENHPAVRFVSYRKNQGQSSALFAGFMASRGRWVITLDSDLQNPPEEIPRLMEFEKEFDFITGIRKERKDSAFKRLSSGIARSFRQVVLNDITQDTGCSLRMFKREVITGLPYFRNFHRFFTLMAREAGFNIKEVPLKHNERKFGTSKYSTWKRAKEGIFDLIGMFWLKRRLIKSPRELSK